MANKVWLGLETCHSDRKKDHAKAGGADSDMPEWERMRRLDEAGIVYEPGD